MTGTKTETKMPFAVGRQNQCQEWAGREGNLIFPFSGTLIQSHETIHYYRAAHSNLDI